MFALVPVVPRCRWSQFGVGYSQKIAIFPVRRRSTIELHPPESRILLQHVTDIPQRAFDLIVHAVVRTFAAQAGSLDVANGFLGRTTCRP